MAQSQTKLKQPKGRVPLIDKMRSETNYAPKRFTGYTPIPHAALAEASRLANGTGFKLLMFILDQSLGSRVKETEPFCETTDRLRTYRFSEFARCNDHTVTRELGDLEFRKVIAVEKPKKGTYIIRPLFRTWASLPDYEPAPLLEPDPPDPEEEDELEPEGEDEAKSEDEAKVKTTVIISKPVHVAAGKRSEPVKIACGVSALQFSADVDAEWSAVVKGGTLLVSLKQRWQAENGVSGIQKQKQLTEKEGQHGRFSGGQSSQKGAGVQSNGKSPVQHPRSEELSSLFDPLIYKWCSKTLSGDPQAHLKACNAIGDTPHDDLVKAAVERAWRKLTPLHIEALCREIQHNWKKSKDMPKKAGPSSEELQEIIRQSKLTPGARGAEERAKKGRVA